MLISAWEIINQSWKLYITHWRKIIVYILLLYLPTVVLSVSGFIGLYLSANLPTSNLANNIIILLIFAASLVFSLWASLALTITLRNLIEGQTQVGVKEVFTGSSRLILPVIYTSALAILIILLGGLLLVIPGIIFAVWYAFVFTAVVLDDKRGLLALRASKSLVAGRWWAIVWRLIIPGVVFGLLVVVIQNIIYLPLDAFVSSKIINMLVSNLLSSLVAAILTPLTVSATVILYLNAKQTPLTLPPTPDEPPHS